ncbi:MAG TPA: succinate dehydrogenase, hydrophobic membrane anchor protein [Parvularculaceae bacterium]|nr:succinate dehydrogenase, hydrophobic membrane anchor protein [Parvularculaceae bacterium]
MTHKGTSTFIAQRASAVALLFLVIWFLWTLSSHAGAGWEETLIWLAAPTGWAPMGLLIAIGAFHMRIGLNEIIDDYVNSGARGVLKLLNLFACLGAALIGLWSLFLIAA